MKRLALSIGLTRLDPAAYGGWDGACPGCDRDAARWAAACHDAGFDGAEVLINAMATAARIKAAFLGMLKGLAAGDLLVLANSGHGGQMPDQVGGDELDGRDETLCWFDGERNDDVIASFLSRVPRGVRVLTISDTCNSGSNFRGRRDVRRSTPARPPAKAVARFRGSLIHFGGCSDGRASFGDDQGGVLSIAALDALARARRPISYREWFRRTAQRMPAYQVPVFEEWGGPPFSERVALT